MLKLNTIRLINFKSHVKSEIKPRKITVLIGPTNSGKSSILQSLLLLKNTASQNKTTFEARGTTYDYGSYEEIITGGDIDKIMSIGISGIKESSKYSSDVEEVTTEFDYNVSTSGRHQSAISLRVKMGVIGVDYKFVRPNETKTYAWDNRENINLKILRAELEGINPRIQLQAKDEVSGKLFRTLFMNGTYTEKLLDEFYYIPFSRVVTAYRLPIEYSSEIISTNQEKTASALLSRISANPKLRRKISRYISRIGGKSIEARNIETYDKKENIMTLDFVKDDFSNSIINEGSGLNQLVLLLAVLVDAPRESIITIEEPELHLDPVSQSKLMSILLEQIENEEKQIIFTTHSEHMLFPLLANISKKDRTLTEKDVAIYYFNLDNNGKFTGIDELEINEHGQIKGGLKGFWDVDANAMSDILGEVDE